MLIALFSNDLMAEKMVSMTIDYADKKPLEVIEVEFRQGMTALELLQRAAKISTKTVGKYIFVSSINGVKSHSKNMGWFYSVDGVDANKIASDNVLKDVKEVRWTFKTANCGT